LNFKEISNKLNKFKLFVLDFSASVKFELEVVLKSSWEFSRKFRILFSGFCLFFEFFNSEKNNKNSNSYKFREFISISLKMFFSLEIIFDVFFEFFFSIANSSNLFFSSSML
jgi:hypothetical protein